MCERFVSVRGMLAWIPRIEARRRGVSTNTYTTERLAHSALPAEPSGSPSPLGRGLGWGGRDYSVVYGFLFSRWLRS